MNSKYILVEEQIYKYKSFLFFVVDFHLFALKDQFVILRKKKKKRPTVPLNIKLSSFLQLIFPLL